MLSDERVSHILHLILNGLQREGLATFSDKERATREGRKAFGDHFKMLDSVAETARKRILSQKNAPPEHSSQWETLYRKYYEEELKRK
ncbi:MAG: DUF507 family protein [Deltaproteobacteria bacterium]|nr:DUF507 family protein [Deltaproteobacteria bacterium]MBI3295521.1 DUF507 family protein [Deltaproteobacteria bacterium]